jgi:hypothetical protein
LFKRPTEGAGDEVQVDAQTDLDDSGTWLLRFVGHWAYDATSVHHIPQHDAADRLSAVVAAAVHPDVHRTAVMHRN